MDVVPHTSNSFKFAITDFGLAVRSPLRSDVEVDGAQNFTAASYQRIPHMHVGKPPYKAPEIYFGGDPVMPFVNPMLSDMWALGIILFAVLTGSFAFEDWLTRIVRHQANAGYCMMCMYVCLM